MWIAHGGPCQHVRSLLLIWIGGAGVVTAINDGDDVDDDGDDDDDVVVDDPDDDGPDDDDDCCHTSALGTK